MLTPACLSYPNYWQNQLSLQIISLCIEFHTHRPCGSIVGCGVEACLIWCPLVSYPGTGNSCKKKRSELLKRIDLAISNDIVV